MIVFTIYHVHRMSKMGSVAAELPTGYAEARNSCSQRFSTKVGIQVELTGRSGKPSLLI